jgi:tellurite resistance protein
MEFIQIQAIVDQALADGYLTQAEMEEIIAAIDSDACFSTEERELLNSIYARIRSGEIRMESLQQDQS